ncbi:MAG: hypothetical protein IKP37_01255 [Paludibacteraceae bacterium]|nr:hypothetical protein [Paludibacteraceae bacterium]
MSKHLFIALAVLLSIGSNAFAAKTIDGKQITEIKEWIVTNGKKTIDEVTKYDDKGNKTEVINYKDGEMKERTTYKYNANGKCIEEEHYDKFNKLEKTVKIEYNASGKKSAEKTYQSNGKLKSEHTFEYITK